MSSDNNLKAKTAMTTILLIAVLICAMSCKECPTEPDYEVDFFTLDYAGPSFVSLAFGISGSGKRNYSIQRDSLIVLTGILHGEDTIVTDWNDEPSTAYRYRLLIKDGGETVDKSDWLSVTTMDTTSHDFTWIVDVLGENGIFWDVWAFAGNNVWAVGKYERTWDDSESFSLAKWDGQTWTNHYIAWTWLPIQCIFAFSPNDVWCWAGYPAHHNGNDWYIYTETNSDFPFGTQYNDCWGPNTNDIYFVGNGGAIVHYDGQSFTKMTSPTDRDLLHIDGCMDSQTGETRMWAGGWSYSESGSLIEYKDGKWELIWDEGNYRDSESDFFGIGGIFIPNDKYVIINVGEYSMAHTEIHRQDDFNSYCLTYSDIHGSRSIYGNAINDFFEVGDGHIIHYNGKTTKKWDSASSNYRLRGINQTGDTVFIVGENMINQNAIVIRGKRQ
ncbi:MAG: hypothetical protein WC611_06665 [Candidatus Neomarinimicrobiota bacterium]